MWLALKRVAPPALLGLLPALVLVIAAVAARHGQIGIDFRAELYPEAKLVLQGKNPFPAPHADLSSGVNRIYPILAALLVTPLTVLPVGVAAVVFVALLLLLLLASVRALGVTDWRVYGVALLWPASIAALQTGNLTIPLCFLVALAWRWRDRPYAPGLAVGVAIALKLFLWPLLFWLLALRSYRAVAAGICVAAGSLLLMLPFTTLGDYVRLMNHLGNTFTPVSYNVAGLLVQSGVAGLGAAKLTADAVGVLILVFAFTRQSLPLSLAAALILSPIVWLHYFALLIVPLAIARPRFALGWLVPLALWACPGSFHAVRERHIVIALVVLAAVTIVAESARRLPRRGALSRPDLRPAAR